MRWGQGLATVSCGSVSCEAIDQHFQLIFAPIIRQHYVAGNGEREKSRERERGSKGEKEREGARERGNVREFVVPCKCATCSTSFALAAQTFAEPSYKVCYVPPSPPYTVPIPHQSHTLCAALRHLGPASTHS